MLGKIGVVGISCFLLLGCGSEQVDSSEEKPNAEKKIEKAEKKEEKVKILFNLNDVADQDVGNVKNVLGEGKLTDSGTFRLLDGEIASKETYEFRNGTVEVMFLDGIAGRITITPEKQFSFKENDVEMAFKTYGLPVWMSDQQNENAMHFTSVGSIAGDGLYEVTVFNDNGKVDYIYIITNEEFK